MASLLKEKFATDRFERKKRAFFKRHGWRFMPFAQKDPLPDARLLVPHQVKEVGRLVDMIQAGDLVSFVVSDIGMGKTALCKFLAEALPMEESPQTVSVFLHGPSIETPEQMLRLILGRLELEAEEGDLAAEFEQLYRWHEGYPDLLLLLVMDEFPDIDKRVLEMVRAVADLRGVVWVLNGQKNQLLEFVEEHTPALLRRKRFILELKPMDQEESEELLALRMAWARGDDYDDLSIEPFTRSSIIEIHRRSKGVPREALKLAGDAVYCAVESNSPKITHRMISGPKRRRKRRKVKKERQRRSFWSYLGWR